MKISNYFKTSKKLLIILIILLLANQLRNKTDRPYLIISKQDSVSNFKLPMFQYFNLGNKRMLSSLLWISTILQSDEEHYKKKDQNSWMFVRFNTIADIDPFYRYNYIFGGIYLSIIKDDLPGASIIYDKGLNFFPDDIQLLKDAGFHYYYEAKDLNKSYIIFKKLTELNPKNNSLSIAFAKILSAQGKKEDALSLLIDRYNSLDDKNSLVALKTFEKIYSIKAELDLDCLNSHLINCENLDFEGKPYLERNGFYYAQKEWKPFYGIKKGPK